MRQVEAEFVALGFEVYSQNFSAKKPLSVDSEVRYLQSHSVCGLLIGLECCGVRA